MAGSTGGIGDMSAAHALGASRKRALRPTRAGPGYSTKSSHLLGA